MSEVLWKPHPGPQTDFLSRPEYECLFGGAAGPGKSDCLIIAPLRFVANPNSHNLLLRRTTPQFEEIRDRTFKYYPSYGGTYRSQEKRWDFPSGAYIKLGHMQHEDDKYNYQGKEFSFIGFDELTQFTRTQYLYLFSRCRSSDPSLLSMVRSTSNPGGIGHVWVNDRFITGKIPGQVYQFKYPDPLNPDNVLRLERSFIPGTYRDNPTLFLNDPLYLARLQELDEVERRRLIEGDWEVFIGQVFTQLSQGVHGHEPFEIPDEWYRFCSFDWGFAKPFAVGWYAVDYDGIIYKYREWYGLKDGSEPDVGLRMDAKEIAKGILDREQEKISVRVADPAIWNRIPLKSGGYGPSIREDMAKYGVHFIKANNDRINGISQVHKRFALEKEYDVDGDVISETPRFYAFNNLTHFWRTIPMLQQDEKRVEDIDTDQEDHIFDETRYAFMWRPVKPKKIKPVVDGTFQMERQRYLRAVRMSEQRGVSIEDAYRRV